MVQQPPTAQNYAIGNSLMIASGLKPPCPYPETSGWIESAPNPDPASLYMAQKQTRVNNGMAPSNWVVTDSMIQAASC